MALESGNAAVVGGGGDLGGEGRNGWETWLGSKRE